MLGTAWVLSTDELKILVSTVQFCDPPPSPPRLAALSSFSSISVVCNSSVIVSRVSVFADPSDSGALI